MSEDLGGIFRKKLDAREERMVHEIAQDAVDVSGGDPEKAKEIARKKLRDGYDSIIGTILVGIAIKLAFEIIMRIINDRLSQGGPASE